MGVRARSIPPPPTPTVPPEDQGGHPEVSRARLAMWATGERKGKWWGSVTLPPDPAMARNRRPKDWEGKGGMPRAERAREKASTRPGRA